MGDWCPTMMPTGVTDVIFGSVVPSASETLAHPNPLLRPNFPPFNLVLEGNDKVRLAEKYSATAP